MSYTSVPQITITLVPAAQLRLETMAKQQGRSKSDICAGLIEEAMKVYFRNRDDDPAKPEARLW